MTDTHKRTLNHLIVDLWRDCSTVYMRVVELKFLKPIPFKLPDPPDPPLYRIILLPPDPTDPVETWTTPHPPLPRPASTQIIPRSPA